MTRTGEGAVKRVLDLFTTTSRDRNESWLMGAETEPVHCAQPQKEISPR